MADFWWNLWREFDAMSALELFACILLVIYVVLAARGTRWCWPPGILGSAITMVLVYQSDYFLETGLQAYYMLMGAYGWYFWTQQEKANGDQAIKQLDLRGHLSYIGIGTILTLIAGFLFQRYLGNDLAYLDAFTTVFSLIATVLVARRVIDNWLYWIVIDIAGTFLYGYKGFYFFTALYLIYIFIAIAGYINWRKLLAKQA